MKKYIICAYRTKSWNHQIKNCSELNATFIKNWTHFSEICQIKI